MKNTKIGWWKSLSDEKRQELAKIYYSQDGLINLKTIQIKHIYLMEHQEKSYTIEQAVEHLKNGGAIKIDVINDDFLTEILKLAGSDQVNKTCSRLSMYYILHDGGYWVGHPKEVVNTRPTIKLSQITSDNAVNEKPTAHQLYIQSQNDGSDYETLLRENGLIISAKDVVDSAKHSGKNWEEDYPHENGNYSNICIRCKSEFYGHKRRVVCKECVKANEPSEARIIDEDGYNYCPKCNEKLILMSGYAYLNPDSEPFKAGEEIELDLEEKAFSVYAHYCDNCEKLNDIGCDDLISKPQKSAELVKANSELVEHLEYAVKAIKSISSFGATTPIINRLELIIEKHKQSK